MVCNLAKSISTSKTITTVGEVDFNVGPMPHVIATSRFVGIQCQKSKPGSEFRSSRSSSRIQKARTCWGKKPAALMGAAGWILI